MQVSRVTLQPAYVLHSRPYRDSSLLLDLFTRSHGRIAAVAKGVKRAKSKFNGVLQPFSMLLVSWSGRGDLVTLTDAELEQQSLLLQGKSLLAAFYLNEILLHLTQRHDPHPELFAAYHQTICELGTGQQDEVTLRRFECYLLQEIGYGLILDHDVESGEPVQSESYYRYYPEHGPVAMPGPDADSKPLVIQGKTLLALQEGKLTDKAILQEAKYFMRAIINHQLGGRPIKSRELNLHKIL